MKIEVDAAALEGLVRESERARAARAYAQENEYAPCKDILPVLGAEIIISTDTAGAAETQEDDF